MRKVKVIKRIILSKNIPLKSTSFICSKYKFNENFLDIENNQFTKKQAYFLGWIASDGSVHKNNEVVLGLQSNDIDIIEKIKKMLDSNNPIKITKGKIHFKVMGKIVKNTKDMAKISFANQKFANSLRSLGYNEKKSYNLKFPHFLNKNVIFHFFRSFIEGDGSITYSCNNLSIKFVSTKEFCMEFKKFIEKQLNINVYLRNHTDIRNTTHFEATINGNTNALKFLNLVYKDAFIYLNRKYDKFISAIEKINKLNAHKLTREQLNISYKIIEENKITS